MALKMLKMLHNSCNMCTLDLTDMYPLALGPAAPMLVNTYQSNHSCTCYNYNLTSFQATSRQYPGSRAILYCPALLAIAFDPSMQNFTLLYYKYLQFYNTINNLFTWSILFITSITSIQLMLIYLQHMISYPHTQPPYQFPSPNSGQLQSELLTLLLIELRPMAVYKLH